MRKSKILATALVAALVGSVAATAAMSVSAAGIGKVDDIKSHSVGITGSFNAWEKTDVEMTDADGDGVFEGVVDIESVTADMISEATMDDGAGNQVPRGKKGITFKVRLDKDWTDSWGDYEPAYVRTYNSQTNCVVEAVEGHHVKITVKLDTTKNCPEAIAAGEVEEGDDVDYGLIPVTYSVEDLGGGAAEESTSTEQSTATEESTATTETSTATATTSKPAATTTTTPSTTTPAGTANTDGASPATGDTTSAIALVAVVLASLGTAVVMTKKASKE